MTIMEEIMESPVYKDMEAKLRDAANSLFVNPFPCTAKYVEHYRADLQYQYDLMYEAGLIPTRPTVYVKSFNPQSGAVDFDINFPVTTFEALVRYAEDETENDAIDSPLDNG